MAPPAARTQVGIIGAGPAGLLLSQLLHLRGIASVVLERASRAYVEERVRAGVLEPGTVEALERAGVGERIRREGMVHDGIELRFGGRRHRIDLRELTGRSMTVYGQQEVVKDLIAARLAAGGDVRFEVEDARLEGIEGDAPALHFRDARGAGLLRCDYIAGCDGSHGACRASIPAGAATVHTREYPFAWLGILAEAPPASPELVYSRHDEGFALFSMRSPRLTRLYLQCAPDEDLAAWSDARIWETLHRRLEARGGWRLMQGPIVQRSVTPMRSYVMEPMQHGRLFLAGDAAHILPPTGAKGLNLAVEDACALADAFAAAFAGDASGLGGYSARRLGHVRRAEHFSWWMTSMLHRFEEHDALQRRAQLDQLEHLAASRAASQALAQSYLGLDRAPASRIPSSA